jgi:hypothetical protein
MSPERELDLELLDSSLRQQENARQAFARDLKIAFVLVLGFQFVIFFRFIDLNDQIINSAKQLGSLQKGQKAFDDVQARLGDLKTVLQQGQSELSEQLKSVPSSLREQIDQFETVLGGMRHPPSFVGSTPGPPSPMIQMPIQSPAPSLKTSFVQGLSDSDMKILTSSDFGNPAFEKIVARIVDDRIVLPAFAALNIKKEQLLEQPCRAKNAGLLSALQTSDRVLEEYGLKAGQVTEVISQVQTQLDHLRFTPPRSDRWWKTFTGKMRTSQDLVIDTGHVGDQIGQELSSQQLRLESVGSQLTGLIQEGQAKKELMASQMQEVEDRYKLVQDRLQTYARPLSVVAVRARDAVLYYPVIVAALFVYLTARYLLLRGRARQLAANYRNLGVPDDVLHVSLGDFPGVQSAHRPSVHLNNWFVLATGLVPGLLGIISLHRILGSPDLMKDAPVLLYGTAGALYLVSDARGYPPAFYPQVSLTDR